MENHMINREWVVISLWLPIFHWKMSLWDSIICAALLPYWSFWKVGGTHYSGLIVSFGPVQDRSERGPPNTGTWTGPQPWCRPHMTSTAVNMLTWIALGKIWGLCPWLTWNDCRAKQGRLQPPSLSLSLSILISQMKGKYILTYVNMIPLNMRHILQRRVAFVWNIQSIQSKQPLEHISALQASESS